VASLSDEEHLAKPHGSEDELDTQPASPEDPATAPTRAVSDGGDGLRCPDCGAALLEETWGRGLCPGCLLRGAQLSPGEVTLEKIGPYALVEPLGEGGMGTVWLAHQEEPVRRDVALKVIKLGMDTREVVARFEAERQALAMMNHRGIARVLDAGATELGSPYFVMEHVLGEPINVYCDRHFMTVRDRLALFGEVCDAVQHAHQKGIVHRDLKSSNVLVTDHEGTPSPKIIDFGLAKAMDQRLSDARETRVGEVMGTPAYMSPEQLDPLSVDIDTRTDIYSLGVMLYELLTGQLPFDAERMREAGIAGLHEMLRNEDPLRLTKRLSTLGEGITQIAARRHAEPATLMSQLRGDLEWVVAKAMDKDRDRRYAAASDLADDIRRHLRHEPVEARPASTVYRLRKFARRRKGLVLGIAAVIVALVGGLAATSVMYVRAERRRAEAVRERGHANDILNYFTLDLFSKAAQLGDGAGVGAIFDLATGSIGGEFETRPVSEARFRGQSFLFYWRAGDLEAAERELRRGLELTDDPDDCGDDLGTDCMAWNAWGNLQLGKVRRSQGNLAAALAAFEKALESTRAAALPPGHRAPPHVFGELIFATIALDDLVTGRMLQEELVESSFRLQAAAVDPEERLFHARNAHRREAYLGEIMRRQGDLAGARELLERVLPSLEAIDAEPVTWDPTWDTEWFAWDGQWSLVQTLRQQGLAAEADEVARQLCWLIGAVDAGLSDRQRRLRDDVRALCSAQ
jgi:serine/threonine protein kinase